MEHPDGVCSLSSHGLKGSDHLSRSRSFFAMLVVVSGLDVDWSESSLYSLLIFATTSFNISYLVNLATASSLEQGGST